MTYFRRMQFGLRITQLLIMFAIGSAAIYLGVESGYLIAVWCFLGAYGFTLAYQRLLDWRFRRIDASLGGE